MPDRRDTVLALLLTAPLALAALALFLAPAFAGPEELRHWWWAGLHLWVQPLWVRASVPFVFGAALLWLASRRWGEDTGGWPSAVRAPGPAALLGLFAVLWILRPTSVRFGDSEYYTLDLIPREAFSDRGAIIRYESVGTTALYSFGYRFASDYFRFDPVTWYNIFGIACLFAFLAWAWSRREAVAEWSVFRGSGRQSLSLLLFLASANWTQAVAGAPEHYGQVFLAIVAYAILAVECLKGRAPLWQPCLAYCAGAFFHLIIGWLGPTLLFLVAARWRRIGSEERQLAAYAVLLPALLTGSLCYWFGFDLSFYFESNAAKGKLIPFIDEHHAYTGATYHYATFDPEHLAHIAQEILLMGWPAALLLAGAAPRIRWGRVLADAPSQFLALLLGCSLLFALLWNPDLEFWRDQDLFSLTGLALCLWVVGLLNGPAGSEIPPGTRNRLAAAAIIAGFAWRIPVLLYHSVLSPNYAEPEIFRAVWPFGGH